MSWINLSSQMEPEPEPELQPADFMEECTHTSACRMQWERINGKYDDKTFDATDVIAKLLGCGEDCEVFEEYECTKSYKFVHSLSGTMRPAKRVIAGDGIVGNCKCESCGGSIGIRDRYCKHCGTELTDG